MSETTHFLPCSDYAEGKVSAWANFLAFRHAADNLYYFAMVDASNRVLLRSKGYETEGLRNDGIQDVMHFRDHKDHYRAMQEQAGWVLYLTGKRQQVIACSCPMASEAEALGLILQCYSAHLDGKGFPGPDEANDYLPCEAYENQPASAFPGFTAFQDDTAGWHYFAMVDFNDRVILKSEAYKTAGNRNQGIEAVIRNRDEEDRWRKQSDAYGWYMSLHAANSQEIGRTCHFESESALLGWWIPFSAHFPWKKP
jgi:uncharacterized protein YegP (UPF0339 family)